MANVERQNIEKCGVAWKRVFKNGKEGLKISLNKQIYLAFPNTKKGSDDKQPDFVIIKYLDTPEGK
jgi:hypothetical protein